MRTKPFQYFLLINLIFSLIGLSTIIPHASLNPLQSGSFNAALSTNPANPDLLNVGIPITGQSYAASTSYYYKTNGSALSSRYSVIWVYPGNRDCNLYFSNNNFTTFMRNSTRGGNSVVEWVVFRPSSSQALYARVRNAGGLAATGVSIEWEDSVESLTTTTWRSKSLSTTNAIEVYGVSLVTTFNYTIHLVVPGTANFDLYLYSLASGAAANLTGFLRISNSGGNGGAETIAGFIPSAKGPFAVLVVRASGTGAYNLTLEATSIGGGSPGPLNLWLFPVIEIPVFFGVVFGLVGIFYLHRYLKNRNKYW